MPVMSLVLEGTVILQDQALKLNKGILPHNFFFPGS